MSIISIAIQKGGSGKTTTAINLAAAWRDKGLKVLLVDLDPQSNLTEALGVRDEPSANIYELLRSEAAGKAESPFSTILVRNGLFLLPATLDLANAELELVSVYGRENLLRDLLSRVKNDFDHILIDCPPAVGMLTVNALAASDFVILPVLAEFLPMKGLQSFMVFFQKMKKLNASLRVLGILLTRFDSRIRMSHEIVETIEKQHGAILFRTKIRTNNALARAQEQGLDVFMHDHLSPGARLYREFAEEVLKRIEG